MAAAYNRCDVIGGHVSEDQVKAGSIGRSPAKWLLISRTVAYRTSCATQFLLRQQVLALYRRILRGVRQIPDPTDQRYMKEWARGEFRRNQRATDEITIRMMITQGQQQVQELESALKLARS